MYLEMLYDLDAATECDWGSVVLTCQYWNLYIATHKDVKDGPGLILCLQLWEWEKFRTLRQSIAREEYADPPLIPRRPLATVADLERTHNECPLWILQFSGWPYATFDVVIYIAGTVIWQSKVLLILFYIVELRLSDLVLRQFGPFNQSQYILTH